MAVINSSFDQLDVHTLYQLLKLRVDVFVVEQTCPYPELDDKDTLPSTRHLYLKEQGKVLAYARCLAPGISFEQGSAIGRVVVNPDSRGQGYVKVIMAEAIKTCQQHWIDKPVLVSAQSYLVGFYQSLGFVVLGESYDEDGIPHQDMILQSACL
ncbi:GNAT family N-acetyltransferase [Endozoicomonas elysicola]|uniref:GCN5 family acetyltransferase n=1 Tax=Endozoicomonas elysicola TaxID=305900 RepID=A0A081KB62_9GAMM|nr:GNAT family N-acetyltransferase [Endozoicomonas elysicola]KEI71388.1 GCN5 family acetyltransferase [Endozoicomonas elysicola]